MIEDILYSSHALYIYIYLLQKKMLKNEFDREVDKVGAVYIFLLK